MQPSSAILKFKDALRRALLSYENSNGRKGKRVQQGDALRLIATRLIHLAINGKERDSLPAIKELIDRLDGKPIQSIAGADGEPLTLVQRVIVQQVATDDGERPPLADNPTASKLIN